MTDDQDDIGEIEIPDSPFTFRSTDKERDLEADLILCDRSPPGPWALGSLGISTGDGGGRDYWIGPPDEGPPDCVFHWHEPDTLGEDEEDPTPAYLTLEAAEMIAAAREGWPAAIRRALVAEALVDFLKEQLDRIRTGRGK